MKLTTLLAAALALITGQASADQLTETTCSLLAEFALNAAEARDAGISAQTMISGLGGPDPRDESGAIHEIMVKVTLAAYVQGANLPPVIYSAAVMSACLKTID